MSADGTTERTLQNEIAQLVVERQDLRASGASEAALEHNRCQLAGLQRELSRLLIDLYLPRAERSAA
jgi:hypothetical protein